MAETSFPSPDYRPDPIDTSLVELDPQLLQLTELLAEHTHDLWARERLAQGWLYGPVRDDGMKQHPCLVSYHDLPESEKRHDRITALGTIRALVALGWQLSPVSAAEASAAITSEAVETIRQELEHGHLDVNGLQALWDTHSPKLWAAYPELYVLLGRKFISRDHPLFAYDVLSEGLSVRPRDLRLRQVAAHALAKAGGSAAANAAMQKLYAEGHRDSETLGILGATHKNLALAARSPVERQRQLRLALQYYSEGFSLSGKSYNGINAATLAFLLGDRESAQRLAQETRRAATTELEGAGGKGPGTYWEQATLGEAALLLGRESEAAETYREAVSHAGENFLHLASTRRNASLILEANGRPPELLDQLIPLPRVVVFTGHMIDRPGRATPRFPPSAEAAVARALDDTLARLGAGFGFSSAASGGDILFLEAMTRRGGKTNIVLPFPEADFLPESVVVDDTGDWSSRFALALGRAESVRRAVGQRFTRSPVFFEYANLLLLGLARLKSARLGVELIPLALWDGEPGYGGGGTAATLAEWQSQGYGVEIIDLKQLADTVSAPQLSPSRSSASIAAPEMETGIMAVLFADVVNFSKLSETEIPLFVKHFLGAVGTLVHQTPNRPVVSNTWGDGLYFIFRSVAEAGEWALRLCEMAATTDWEARGLRKDLNLRVALHAGPLFSCIDPVTNQRNFTGKQVVPAARLEPVTPPGLVYASEEFAAMAAASRVTDFICEPVGRLGLAKGAGNAQVYHITRSTHSPET